MKARKWIALAVTGGLVFELSACTSDLAYYLLTSLADSLPDLLDAWLEAASATT